MFFLFIKQHVSFILAIQLGRLAPYIKNLAIPTTLLLVYSFLKYAIAVGRKSISLRELLLELPIDLLCIVSTLIITFYIFSTGNESAIIVGVFILLLSVLVAIVACYFRRYIIECLNSRSGKGYPIVAGIGLYLGVFGWIALVSFLSLKLN